MTRLLTLAVALFALAGQALATEGLVVRQSNRSVAETMDRLEAAVRAAKGPAVFARIDFQQASGNKIRPMQLLIFGSGALLPAFIGASPSVAIDLPVKVLVWEDDAGKVSVAYNNGEFLVARHGLKGIDEAARRFTAGAKNYVDKALE